MSGPPRAPGRLRRSVRGLLAQSLCIAMSLPALALIGAGEAAAQSWTVEGESNPSAFDCDHLYYSNYRSGMQYANDANGRATIQNTVISKRNPTANGLPDYWSTNMALGKDPDTGKPAAFYSSYTTSNLKLYKHVSGTNTVTDEIAGGQPRNLPSGTNWGGTTADPNRGMLYGAQNGSTPKLFRMDLATGATTVWERGSSTDPLTPVPADDAVFNGGTLVPDMFADQNGGIYYGIVHGGQSHIYRLDPATGTTRRAVTVTGPASGNGFNNYGMAWHNDSIYLGYYGGNLYRVDPKTGASTEVGGLSQNNQVGTVKSESGGSWPITDLASCSIATDLTAQLEVEKTASLATAEPGDTVTYTVTAKNTGNAPLPSSTVTDDLTGVVDDATYNDDARATVGGSSAATQPKYDSGTKKLTWTGGPIAAGATVTLTYSVTVGRPPAGDKVLKNTVTAPDSNCKPDSTGPECSSETPVRSLEIKKKADKSEVKPGDRITYTVTVKNTGGGAYEGAAFTDGLDGVLDDATWDDVVTTTSGTTSYDGNAKTLTWSGDVAKGATVTVTYRVTVGSPPAGDKILRNAVTGPDSSSCPPDSTDPECATVTPVKSLKIKKTAAPENPKPGEKVVYTVTVENTGGGAYEGASFTDDLTDVLDDARWDDDVTASPGTASFSSPKLTWSGDLAAGAKATVTYTVTVTAQGDKYLRNAVTGTDSNCPPGSKDPDCATVVPKPALDIKKTAAPGDPKPGDKVTYTLTLSNSGSAPFNGVTVTDDLAGVLDDATWDDSATASAGTVAYARPELTWTGDVAPGATVTVTYTVTVGKPPKGDKILKNAVTGPDGSTCEPDSNDPDCSTVTPLPALDIKKTAAPTSAKPGQKVTYTVTVKNTGQADYKGASFSDDLAGVLDDATWDDTVHASTGTASFASPKLTWTGTVAVGTTATVTYVVTVAAPPKGDKILKNAVTGPDGSTCPPDSTDPACTTETRIAELEIKKTASPAVVKPGQKVTYTVTVKNPGTATYTGARFEDDLTQVLDDAAFNDDAKATAGTVRYAEPTVTWTHDLPAGQSASLTYSVTVNRTGSGDGLLKNAVTGPDDSNCPPNSTDPDCGTQTRLAKIEIDKSTTAKNPKPGDTVTYSVQITNTGQATYTGARFDDDLTGLLDDAAYNEDATATEGTVVYRAPTLTWSGDVTVGRVVSLTYTVTVGSPPKGDKILKNAVTGTEDTNCPPQGTDPRCSTVTPLPALRIEKSVSPRTAKAGDEVTYTVTVTNTGQAAYPDASFTDDLTGILDDATYNRDATATSGTVDYREPTLTWTGTVAKGATATITYSAAVNRPPAGDKVLRNAVTSTGSNCPPDSTDPDCATVVPLTDLRIKKTASPANPKPGDEVTYTVKVENAGRAPYENASFTDDLTDVLDDAAWGGNLRATSGTAAFTRPAVTWRGDVGAGATVTVTYTVTVGRPPQGDKTLKNAVTGPDGSNCPPDGTDPDCSTVQPVPQLRITKSGSPREVKQGDTITYTVVVQNVGKGDYPGASFTDDLTEVLDDATYNRDATATGGTVDYREPTLTWTGDLGPGDSATVAYTVTVTNAGDKKLKNTVTGAGSNCEPASDDPRCSEELPSPQLEVAKSARPAFAVAGGRVTYTVTVHNSGTTAYQGASYVDDLTGVLDDAAYDRNARASAGRVSYAAPKLTWTGDVPSGATVTVTYTVTVKSPLRGDKTLKNSVTSDSQTNCPLPMPRSAPVDPRCGTATPIQQLTLRKTSAPRRVRPGGTVTYTVTATNTGRTEIARATFTDNLAKVLTHAAHNRDTKATRGTTTLSGTRLTWKDASGRTLKPGESATVTYSVRVHANASGKRLVNAVTTSVPGGVCADRRPLPCSTAVTPRGGKVALLKKDAKTGQPLKGAVFQLWRETNGRPGLQRTDKAVGAACATDARGRCTFTGLPNGTFYLKELAAREGYVVPADPVSGPYRITDRTETVRVSLTNKRGEPCKGKKGGTCGK
ncbi:isopeptide-forming domain-containing fimbrial protein [Streptomyces sp. NPDC050504]|uniref:DUF7927 domain-containing protein n=1 Tax=Streptomyces sp. NPDC050504 TaxID=3365618 RepID=UPI00379D3D9E